ncbi:PH domain-containing protein [Luteimicrobium sp. DT211]|uniref:PH domain-containing protein n=1 Tax=Luteimicrobium sp. DT211 TaxID=3393412 RepID=UPI003CF92016
MADTHLTDGEDVVLELRTHAKALFWPIVLLVVLVAAVAVTAALGAPAIAVGVVGVVAFLLACVVVLPRWVRWLTTRYVVTTKRVLVRSGVVTRIGRDIPLYRINDIASERGLLDRMFGCGTLVVSDASEKPGLVLHDVPDVEDVQVRLHELLFAHDDGSDDGEFPPGEPRRPRGR